MSRFVSNNTNRNQVSLIPSSLEEMISQDNPVRVIDIFADSLDLNIARIRTNAQKISEAGKSYDANTMTSWHEPMSDWREIRHFINSGR